MATYHLHARLFEGSLAAPTRDELQTRESDDYAAAVALAEELAARGFAVWVYRHDHLAHAGRPGDPASSSPYRVVAEWRADGSRLR
ncbi:hypothetical protein GCM10023199_13870 [Actinomycetospora chibensis]